MVDVTRRSIMGFAAALPFLAHTPWVRAQSPTVAEPVPSDEVLINFNESPWGGLCLLPGKRWNEGSPYAGATPIKPNINSMPCSPANKACRKSTFRLIAAPKQPCSTRCTLFTQNGSLVVATPSYEDPVEAARGRKSLGA